MNIFQRIKIWLEEMIKLYRNPLNEINGMIRDMESDLGFIKRDTAEAILISKKADKAYENCLKEIISLKKYEEEALKSDNKEDAELFALARLEKEEQLISLTQAKEVADESKDRIIQIHDTLSNEIIQAKTKESELKVKQAVVNASERILKYSSNSYLSKTTDIEERVNDAILKADVMYELNTRKTLTPIEEQK